MKFKYLMITKIFIFLMAVSSCYSKSENVIPETTAAPSKLTPTIGRSPIGTETIITDMYPFNDGCIESFETFSYNVPEWDRSIDLGKILPISPWQVEGKVPVLPSEDYWVNLSVSVIDTRNIDNEIEIWLKGNAWNNGIGDSNEFLIFKPATKEWKIISGEIAGAGIRVGRIFIASDNTIWGLNFFDDAKAPTLSKFNEENERFEFLQELPKASFNEKQLIFDREESVFWFFVSGDAIYSLNPATQETRRHTEIPTAISSVALASDGSIYFDINSMAVELQEEEIYQFFPDTGEIRPLEIPNDPWPVGSDLLVDSLGNLWFGTIGWLDTKANWHLLHPDPDGYFENIITNPSWALPELKFESSNGYLWLKRLEGLGIDGMAWYDPKTGDGCWFTTEYALNIVEDANQNLWMVVDGILYKLEL